MMPWEVADAASWIAEIMDYSRDRIGTVHLVVGNDQLRSNAINDQFHLLSFFLVNFFG
jgi:hypothetical protein